jgi:hypothetical protein
MIARALDAFTRWALAKYPASRDEGTSSTRRFGAYVIPNYMTGAPYITRVMTPRVFGVRPVIHHIHQADHERDPHNHPSRWMVSILLSGQYDEERIDVLGQVRERRVRWFNVITSHDFHRITELHGDVWTLFIMGPRVQSWGFLVHGVVEPWRAYIARRKLWAERAKAKSAAR